MAFFPRSPLHQRWLLLCFAASSSLSSVDIVVVVSANTIVSLNATKDNRIVDGSGSSCRDDADDNFGGSPFLRVGRNDCGIWRSLVEFDLSSAASTSALQSLRKATLVLDNDGTFGGYIPCTSANPSICATVHILTTLWGEGDNIFNTANTGESSWLHSAFPTEWQTPGGDFQEQIVGRSEPETSDDDFWFFPLDIDLLQPLLDDPDRLNFGFLIRNDDNTGRVLFQSRESSYGPPPRLELEFDDGGTTTVGSSSTTPSPTVAPTNRPTTRPPTPSPTPNPTTTAPTVAMIVETPSPTTATPTLSSTLSSTPQTAVAPTPDSAAARLEEACGNFRQSVTLFVVLSPTDRNMFRDSFETSLTGLTSLYIVNSASVATTALVERIDQDEEGGAGDAAGNGVETNISYTMCYEQPASSSRSVVTYPAEFEGYMAVSVNRAAFEEQLSMTAGTQLQPGSLSMAVRIAASEDDSTISSSNENNDGTGGESNSSGLVIGASIGAVLAVLALGIFIFNKKKARKSGSNNNNNDLYGTTRTPNADDSPTTNATQMAVPATTEYSSAPMATAVFLQDHHRRAGVASAPDDDDDDDTPAAATSSDCQNPRGLVFKDQSGTFSGEESTMHPQPHSRDDDDDDDATPAAAEDDTIMTE